jgi:CheY-like chemotaxis protein
MNNVMGMTNLILHTSLTAEQRAYIEKVRTSSNSLVKVFNNVLDFSKAEPVQPQLEENEFDLQSLLEDALDSVAAQAGEKNIRLSLHIREGVPFRAVADSGRLRQVLLNLLSNAVKFTERGSVALSVSKLAVEGDSMTLRFGVRDTGVGLSIEEQSALFQPFQQADPAEKPLVAGSGLDIARRAVALMGGDIGVISRPREGSTFWFSLRLVSAAAPVPEELAPLAGKKVLLLISPDSAVLNIGRYLEYASCEVREKESTDGSCSLVIADSASLKALSQSGWHRISHLPIVILGSPADLSPHLLPAAQPVEYLPQPVRCLALLKAAVQALSRVPAPAPKPAEPAKEELRSPEILLVEDDHINQLITTMFLVKMGYHVTTAGSGKEACAAIDQRAYDLILMDCQMPEMDGFQATRIIREKERAKENGHRHSTPIIALSAGVLKEERDRCRAAGMDDCLPKPLEKQQLESALSTWLNRAETTAV